MGVLLSLLKSDAVVTTDIFVDFENAKPMPEEQQLYDQVNKKMAGCPQLLDSLKNYSGCGEQIRKAISTPSKQAEEEAWAAVCPAVSQLKEFFDFSSVLEECFTMLLRGLCQGSDIKNNLEKKQATAQLLAKTMTFALDFDDLKMTNPSIQNDFSYYRRTLSRLKMQPDAKAMMDRAVVKDELANRMSLFYAYPTPMLKAIVDGLASITGKNTPDSVSTTNVCECLKVMVTVTHVAVSQNKFAKEETLYFCLRVMVASIILYDHVSVKGAFAKDSEISIKTHIKLIQQYGGARTEGLLNALRYTTKHLNDESTPKAIKQMLAQPQGQ
ncbi:hypothetical protein MP228_000401 [Amoeboaphelidium protococcarum]|nr:hypothetical protein MP228_000401 [Amoeboaphelidium protococcarum]